MRSSVAKRRREDLECAQRELPLAGRLEIAVLNVPQRDQPRAIEDEGFPFETLSTIAEIESWRKEINRPLSHLHKWWAQRLGTVFRAIVLATFTPAGRGILDLFYAKTRIPGAVVFDPFMGSGTTIVETLKVGARAIGRDINPVAWSLVRNALRRHDRAAILRSFQAIERDVAPILRRYYCADLGGGKTADVLYYFWVKTVPCPVCTKNVDLFSSYIFAGHAYPKEHPEAQALCPSCGEVNQTRYDVATLTCRNCHGRFDPRAGPANGTKARCSCGHEFSIAKVVRASGRVPTHRLYAKLVLLPSGNKVYLRATQYDRDIYAAAERDLAARKSAFPVVAIMPGYNTNQALGYNYRHWHEMFNARQLLGLSILGDRIIRIEEAAVRELFLCLLSGTLEFNNMFASYKGEGTGAVRHMFSHHILKPERVPLEANLWGTPKSSGSFSTLFKSRVLRALKYAQDPFEVRLLNGATKRTEKVFGLSARLGHVVAEEFSSFQVSGDLYLSCGDSSRTDLETDSVDAVVTDPPFFDNVHYSQLADFFHVWQRHFLREVGPLIEPTTRAFGEVQNSEPAVFTDRLTAVWAECHRVLKKDGLLVFTYHHSRAEGWSSILKAVVDAGFVVVAAHPIKAEMSVAIPKHQAKEPIDLDVIIVCRKRGARSAASMVGDFWPEVMAVATRQVARLRSTGRLLSRNDVRVIVMAQLLRRLSQAPRTDALLQALGENSDAIEQAIERLRN